MQRVSQQTNWWTNVSYLFFKSQPKMRFYFFIIKPIFLMSCDQNIPKLRQNHPLSLLKLRYFLSLNNGHCCLVSTSGVLALTFVYPDMTEYSPNYDDMRQISVSVSAKGRVEHQKRTQTAPSLSEFGWVRVWCSTRVTRKKVESTGSCRTGSFVNGNGFMYACTYVCLCMYLCM